MKLLLLALLLTGCAVNPQLSPDQLAAAAKDGRFVCAMVSGVAGSAKIVVAGGDPAGNQITVSTENGCDKVNVTTNPPAAAPPKPR